MDQRASGGTYADGGSQPEERQLKREHALLAPGTRVRLRSASHVITLQADTGYVVKPAEWLDYYIVHLDRPALYMHLDGRFESLDEIREDADNLEILAG